jgi:thioredoxin-related protein
LWIPVLTGITVLLCACSSGAPEHPEGHAGASNGGDVAWFEGSVDEAFALARREKRPLFLYWGAEWCPPCHHLKNTVFKRPEFVAKTREFVPVYLDGDSERAQILAEELGVENYPTVLIFSAGGEELMRMPRGIGAERYVELLDTALTRMRPVQDVLADVMEAGPANASPEELSLLAFHSWSQDKEVGLSDEEAYETFAALYRETSQELAVERTRFLTHALMAAIERTSEAGEDEASHDLSAEERAAFHSAVMELLDDPGLCSDNLPFVLYAARATVLFLHPDPTPDRGVLVGKWDEAARRIEDDEDLAVDDRLTAIVPRLELASLHDGASGEDEVPAPPPELVNHVRERVAWAAETVTDEGELQTVMSTMAWLLAEVGLGDEAEALLTERMDDAHAPYYFMSVVAGLNEDADRADEAVAWYRKAYTSARGRYSRFRWGSIYLRQVMALVPEQTDTIESDSIEILGELLTLDDAFAGGNLMRLRQLDSAYRSWNENREHDELVGRIRDLVQARCDDYTEAGEDSQRARCLSFLAESG